MTTPQTRKLPSVEGLRREYLQYHAVCPRGFADDGRTLVVVAAPGARLEDALDDLGALYDAPVVAEQAPLHEVEAMIERLFAAAEREIELSRSSDDGTWRESDVTADVRDLANQPPVVRYVNLLVRDAYDAGASDIHLEATRTGLVARLRLDGVLAPAPEPPPSLGTAVVSRVKLLAELDIAERRRPQDGRIRVRMESRELDLRVSTVPTMFGESVVLRLLDRGGRPVELEELGMPDELLATVGQLLARPHGLFLVTGPTGSGKTTTLYACLQRRRAAEEKIVTVEDPVEYQLPGITQVPVHAKAGVSFAAALRSILRQDPDVLMIGEMRDGETAEIAVQAAMTGHLVLSTLHTNDAVSAIPRLVDLGVPTYLAAATLEGVLAQRLVRRVCEDCRERYVPAEETVRAIEGNTKDIRPIRTSRNGDRPRQFTRGAGCASCRGTGFRGRIGLYELLRVTDDVKDAIVRGRSTSELRDTAARDGKRSLREDGWHKVTAGLTTVEEVLRVVQG